MIVVGIIAAAGVVLGAYAVLAHDNDSSARMAEARFSDRILQLEVKIGAMDKRIDALGQQQAKLAQGPSVAGPAASTAPVPARTTAATPDRKIVTDGPSTADGAAKGGGAEAYELVANPELKGRLGRIVVRFSDEATKLNARTDTYRAGDDKKIRTDYGSVAEEMPPGIYDIVINERKVPNVRIESGHDTRVHVGVLRLNATSNTRFDVHEADGSAKLQTTYGQSELGFPAGNYDVMVNDQRERVTVRSGIITEY